MSRVGTLTDKQLNLCLFFSTKKREEITRIFHHFPTFRQQLEAPDCAIRSLCLDSLKQ